MRINCAYNMFMSVFIIYMMFPDCGNAPKITPEVLNLQEKLELLNFSD